MCISQLQSGRLDTLVNFFFNIYLGEFDDRVLSEDRVADSRYPPAFVPSSVAIFCVSHSASRLGHVCRMDVSSVVLLHARVVSLVLEH